MSPGRARRGGTSIPDHVQAVVKVLSEGSRTHVRQEVGVRSGEHTHVDFARPRFSQPLETTLLEDAQELDLELGACGPDLVEEHRPAVGGLELALTRARQLR